MVYSNKGVDRKISGREGGNGRKIKNSTIKPLLGGEQRKKDRKIAKKAEKMALLSLYLL